MYSPARVPMTAHGSSDAMEAGGLQSDLLELLHHRHDSSLRLRQQTERAKKVAMVSATQVSELLVEAVNGGVQGSFVNEKRIELEIRSLGNSFTRFMKHTDQWLAASHAINTALKEIGDVENWMKTMEFDCKSVVAAIHNIHQE